MREDLKHPVRPIGAVSSPQWVHQAGLWYHGCLCWFHTAPRGKAHTPYSTPLIYMCKATQNHMQACTVSVNHIILVIKSRSTAFPRPSLFASLQPCLGLRAVSLNSSTVSAAASLQALRYCFLGCKLDTGLNSSLQGLSLLFFFTFQSKDAFGRYVVEKDDVCSPLPPCTHTHTLLLHSHPSAIKQHSPARSQTESKTKHPHSLHFHSAEMGRSRVAQDPQVGQAEINRVNKEYPVQAERG